MNSLEQKIDKFIEATNNRFDKTDQKLDAFIASTDKRFNQLDDRFDQVDFKIEETKKDLKEDIAEVARQGKQTHELLEVTARQGQKTYELVEATAMQTKQTYELLEIVATQTKAHDSEIIAKHHNYTELEERVYKLEQAAHVT